MFFFYLQRTQRSFIPATPWISRPTPSVRTRGISLIPLNQFKCLNMHFHDFFFIPVGIIVFCRPAQRPLAQVQDGEMRIIRLREPPSPLRFHLRTSPAMPCRGKSFSFICVFQFSTFTLLQVSSDRLSGITLLQKCSFSP